MSRGPARFTQADLTRALKGAKNAGVKVARVEVEKDGKIVLIAAKPIDAALSSDAETETDLGL